VTDPRPDSFSFERYLAAKESVDDRALHRPTLDRFRREATALAADRDGPLRVAEAGAGLGAACRRFLADEGFPARLHYTMVERRPSLVTGARESLREWADSREGVAVTEVPPTSAVASEALRVTRPAGEATVEFVAGDAFEVFASADRSWDALVAAAFVDLVPLSRLSALFDALAPGGLFYFPITFDGETAFRPVADPDREAAVLDRFHRTMVGPGRAGPRAGLDLFDAVPAAGGEVLAAGGSDWLVHPPYPGDEAYFCHHVLDLVESAVAETLEGSGDGAAEDGLTRAALRTWATGRHRAVAGGELTYLAHNLDVCGRV
jgi:SAM-dependent methyltransferase